MNHIKEQKNSLNLMKDTVILTYWTTYVNINCHSFEQTCFFDFINLLLFDLHITSVNSQTSNRQFLILMYLIRSLIKIFNYSILYKLT